MTMQPPIPLQTPITAPPPTPLELLAYRAWNNLDDDTKDAALKLVFDDIEEQGWELMDLYIKQAALETPKPADRERNYLTRPLGNWERLKQKYSRYYQEDLRDFRKLNPQAAEELEVTLLILEMQARAELGAIP